MQGVDASLFITLSRFFITFSPFHNIFPSGFFARCKGGCKPSGRRPRCTRLFSTSGNFILAAIFHPMFIYLYLYLYIYQKSGGPLVCPSHKNSFFGTWNMKNLCRYFVCVFMIVLYWDRTSSSSRGLGCTAGMGKRSKHWKSQEFQRVFNEG